MEVKVKNWLIEELTGYKPITTSYTDLGLAEPFSLKEVEETAKNLFEQFKNDHKKLTELVMALNWKSFEHADDGIIAKSKLCNLYIKLYNKYSNYYVKHFKGDELAYFYRVTD